MATPIDPEVGEVAYDVVPRLVEFLIARGVSGLFVGGTTGEGILLPLEERRRLHEVAMAAAGGRVPVLLHVGALRIEDSLSLARQGVDLGADAMVAVTPVFYGMHDQALAAYYEALAQAAPELPLFAYDIPHMAANGISPALAQRMFATIPSFAGLKSSNSDAQIIRRLLDVVPDDRLLLVGNESIALGSLALGADGLISGLATAVPEPFVCMTRAFAEGDLAVARSQQRIINQLLAHLPAGARIGAVKAILEARGVPVGPPRRPLPAVNEDIWPPMAVVAAL